MRTLLLRNLAVSALSALPVMSALACSAAPPPEEEISSDTREALHRAAGMTPGAVRGSTFYLRNSNTTGVADITLNYGFAGAVPLAGDWNGDGIVTPGVFNPATQTFYLRNSNTTGVADLTFSYGTTGGVAIVGDWDGNGTDTVGVFDPSSNNWYLRNSNTAGVADRVLNYGFAGVLPIAGDWDGNGTDTIGAFDPRSNNWYLRNTNTTGVADLTFNYGFSGGSPVVGDWDGNGSDTVGIVDTRIGRWYLRNSNTTGFAENTFNYGNPGDKPISGNWGAAAPPPPPPPPPPSTVLPPRGLFVGQHRVDTASCPTGEVLIGAHLSEDLGTCAKLAHGYTVDVRARQHVRAGGNQVSSFPSMMGCPENYYVTGLEGDGLRCDQIRDSAQRIVSRGTCEHDGRGPNDDGTQSYIYNIFANGLEYSSGRTRPAMMHVCRQGAAMVGLHNGQNDLYCCGDPETSPGAQAPPWTVVPPPVRPPPPPPCNGAPVLQYAFCLDNPSPLLPGFCSDHQTMLTNACSQSEARDLAHQYAVTWTISDGACPSCF